MLASALSKCCNLKAWLPPGVAVAVVSLDSRCSGEGICSKNERRKTFHYNYQSEGNIVYRTYFDYESVHLRRSGTQHGISLFLPGRCHRIWHRTRSQKQLKRELSERDRKQQIMFADFFNERGCNTSENIVVLLGGPFPSSAKRNARSSRMVGSWCHCLTMFSKAS